MSRISKIKYTGGGGLFHDSRGDVKKLGKKLNECIEIINKQEQRIEELENKLRGEDINE